MEAQRPFDAVGDAGLFQMTRAISAVQIRIELGAALALVLDGVKSLPFVAAFHRHRIVQTKRDELDNTGLIAVRQESARVPSAKRCGRLLSVFLIERAPLARCFVGMI